LSKHCYQTINLLRCVLKQLAAAAKAGIIPIEQQIKPQLHNNNGSSVKCTFIVVQAQLNVPFNASRSPERQDEIMNRRSI